MRKRELQQKLAALVTEERAQLKRLESEGRALLGDEQEQYEKRAKDIGEIESQIAGFDKLEAAAKANEERNGRLSELERAPERPTERREQPNAEQEQRSALRTLFTRGERGLADAERRALSVGTDTAGGFIRTPEIFVTELLKAVDDATPTRGISSVKRVGGAESLGVPTLDADPADADWTAELLTGSEDSTMAFGKREMRPHPVAKRIKISNKLLRSSVLDVVGLVRERLAYKFAVTGEKAFMTGTGAQQPLGVFTASNDGVGTARDVSTGNTTTSIGADGLIEAKHAIKAQYWPRLRWQFHRDALKQIRKLKLGNGDYIWQPGIGADLPARILEVAYIANEYAPNTFTTGLYVGVIGDFSYYWIADSLGLEIQVLDQLYAETNQTGYIARMEFDGAPVLAEAFARVKLA